MAIEVTCVGEILVDIIPIEIGEYRDGSLFEIHFGGAPANVAIGISRLGHRSAFVGAVGEDPFGRMLERFLAENGVDTRWVIRKKARTSLAFVVLCEGGERDFFFYREPWVKTADTLLDVDDIDIDSIAANTKVLHVSGVATAYPPLSEAVYEVMRKAFSRGVFVSIDPNYRSDIWGSGERALEAMDRYLKVSNMITMGGDELGNMFRSEDYRAVARALFRDYPQLEVVAIRLGSQGAFVAKRGGEEVYTPAFRVTPVDTTGAGDAWTAAFIVSHILEGKDLRFSTLFSNAVAALKCTRRGAVSAFPRRDEAEDFLRRNQILRTSS